MKILSRKSLAAKETSPKEEPDRQVHRRIEITVEREIVSVMARGRQPEALADPEQERQSQESILFELPGPS